MLWVLDLDGVVWLRGDPIPGSPEAVARLRAAGERVAFVTNNSGPTIAEHLAALAAAGVEADTDEIITSGQAAAALLPSGTRATVVGAAGIREALTAAGVDIVPPVDKPDAVIVGRTTELDFWELTDAVRAIRSGARFVATNLDATFPTPEGIEPGAGALIAFLETASGVDAQAAGKPFPPVAELLRRRLGQPDVVVGDRPDTDGRFAELLNASFALVLTGVTAAADLPVEPAPRVVGADLASVVSELLGAPGSLEGRR